VVWPTYGFVVWVVVVAEVTGGVTTVVGAGCTLVVQLLREKARVRRARPCVMVFMAIGVFLITRKLIQGDADVLSRKHTSIPFLKYNAFITNTLHLW